MKLITKMYQLIILQLIHVTVWKSKVMTHW